MGGRPVRTLPQAGWYKMARPGFASVRDRSRQRTMCSPAGMSTHRAGDSRDRTLSSTFLGPSQAPCRYVKMERIVLYDRARPCTSRDVVLGDKLTCRLNQNLDDFERATPIETGTLARSSRRARSISHSPDCARTRCPCSGFLTFYQKFTACKRASTAVRIT
jgi:hypothetical protein